MSMKLSHYFAEKTTLRSDRHPSIVAKLEIPQTCAAVRSAVFVREPPQQKPVGVMDAPPSNTSNGDRYRISPPLASRACRN